MTSRFWFYLGSLVIVAGLYSWRLASVNVINNQVGRIDQTGQVERSESMRRYVEKQTDERLLVSLAKRLKYADSQTLQIIIDRAYELKPDSRDIVLLASQFHPELKSRVLELDPLYQE